MWTLKFWLKSDIKDGHARCCSRRVRIVEIKTCRGRMELTFMSSLGLPEGLLRPSIGGGGMTRHIMAVSSCRSTRISSGADMNQNEIRDCSSRKILKIVLTKWHTRVTSSLLTDDSIKKMKAFILTHQTRNTHARVGSVKAKSFAWCAVPSRNRKMSASDCGHSANCWWMAGTGDDGTGQAVWCS